MNISLDLVVHLSNAAVTFPYALYVVILFLQMTYICVPERRNDVLIFICPCVDDIAVL